MENLKNILLKVMNFIMIMKNLIMKVIGKMILLLKLELKNGMMILFIKENILMEKKMVLALISGIMEVFIEENGKII